MHEHRLTVCPFTGTLDLRTQSEIINWMYHKIPGIKRKVARWLVDGTLQDAFLVWIQYRDRALFEAELGALTNPLDDEQMRRHWIREKAWQRLQTSTYGRDMEVFTSQEHVDVDLESLAHLELRMFDRSREAGHAGNCQWGLDIGINQEDWWPYRLFSSNIDHHRDDEEETKASICNPSIVLLN